MPRELKRWQVEAFKHRLVTTAERLIVTRGFDSLTMRELAIELGCSPMLPYRYFEDKDEIIAAVRTHAFNTFAAALESPLEEPGTPPERSHAVGKAYVTFALANPAIYRLMFAMEPLPAGRYPDLDAAMARARATLTAHVHALVEADVIKGEPEVIGHMYWASLHGLVMLELAAQLTNGPCLQRLHQAMTTALSRGMRDEAV